VLLFCVHCEACEVWVAIIAECNSESSYEDWMNILTQIVPHSTWIQTRWAIQRGRESEQRALESHAWSQRTPRTWISHLPYHAISYIEEKLVWSRAVQLYIIPIPTYTGLVRRQQNQHSIQHTLECAISTWPFHSALLPFQDLICGKNTFQALPRSFPKIELGSVYDFNSNYCFLSSHIISFHYNG
jgi:hypothetical protein